MKESIFQIPRIHLDKTFIVIIVLRYMERKMWLRLECSISTQICLCITGTIKQLCKELHYAIRASCMRGCVIFHLMGWYPQQKIRRYRHRNAPSWSKFSNFMRYAVQKVKVVELTHNVGSLLETVCFADGMQTIGHEFGIAKSGILYGRQSCQPFQSMFTCQEDYQWTN